MFIHTVQLHHSEDSGTTEKLPTRIKWIYGSGDLDFSLTNTILRVYFALFLTDVVVGKPSIAAMPFSLVARGIMWTTQLWVTSLTGRVRAGDDGDPSCYLGREDFKKISSELDTRRKAKEASAEITQ